MKVTSSCAIETASSDLAVIAPYFKGGATQAAPFGGHASAVEGAERRGELRGSLYSLATFHGSPSLFLVGLGKKEDLDGLRFLRAVASGARAATDAGFKQLAVVPGSALPSDVAVRASVEGVVLGAYEEGLLKTRDLTRAVVDDLTVVGADFDQALLVEALVIAESVNVARTFVTLPPADLTPAIFADKLTEMSQEVGLQCSVLGKSELENLGMGALLAVSKGSTEPPRVIDMRYGDSSAPVQLAFVGKGLTFDSGGLSLKTADGMEWMKGDMGGAAAVAGAMRAIAILAPPGIFVRGLIGSVENMPGPSAMKPGDVLRTLNGKTIEVLNTDAEGRLVLADMLAYAVQGGATNIVDVATLTGAIAIALGHEAAGAIGRPKSWIDTVLSASEMAIERIWPMPLYPEFRKRMDSPLADIKNTGGRPGGALTASALLSEFVGDVPWAHLDIAGVAWEDVKTPYAGAGGSGFGVATLIQLAQNMGQAK